MFTGQRWKRTSKAPTVKFSLWPQIDQPWLRLHIDFPGPLDGYCNLIMVDSISKWQEILKCKKMTTETVINFLHELIARFGFAVSDNGTQFTSREFKDFCRILVVEHVTIAPYHPRSNGQVEHFVDRFK